MQSAAIRTGLYTGAALALVFSAWLFLANRTALAGYAMARNVVAATMLMFLALIPVMRFAGYPRRMLFAGMLAWTTFSLAYRGLSAIFWSLSDWHSAFQIFILGAVVYFIAATVCWIGCVILRVRAHDISRVAGHGAPGGNSQRHSI
jgi:hypothetical protein